jgi:hypothetical protein
MAVPVFSLFLSPGDSVVLSAILTLVISALTYKGVVGQIPTQVAPAMIGGSVVGTAIGVYFLSNASVDQFRLWIGLSVIVGCIALARFKPGDHEPSAGLSGGTRHCVWVDEWRFCHSRATGGVVCDGDYPPASASARVSDDVLFCIKRDFDVDVHRGRVVTANPFYLFVIAFPVMLAGDRIGRVGLHQIGGRAYRPIVMGVCVMVGGLSRLARYCRRARRASIYCLTLARTIRAFCRCQSRPFSVSRLSCCFLPWASAILAFTRWPFQYSAVHTQVCPFCETAALILASSFACSSNFRVRVGSAT